MTAFVATGLGCAMRTVLLAVLPWCALLIAVRRGAPPDPAKAGAFIGGAAFLMAALLLRFRCPLDERLHLLVWHALPVVGGTLLSALLASLACAAGVDAARSEAQRARDGVQTLEQPVRVHTEIFHRNRPAFQQTREPVACLDHTVIAPLMRAG